MYYHEKFLILIKHYIKVDNIIIIIPGHRILIRSSLPNRPESRIIVATAVPHEPGAKKTSGCFNKKAACSSLQTASKLTLTFNQLFCYLLMNLVVCTPLLDCTVIKWIPDFSLSISIVLKSVSPKLLVSTLCPRLLEITYPVIWGC